MGELREERQSNFFGWLSQSVSPAQLSELYQAFADLEDILSSHIYLHRLSGSLVETTDADAIDGLYDDLSSNRQFMRSYRSGLKLSLLKHYARYCREHKAETANEPRKETRSSGDALIDRLKEDRIAYVDNRPKNGALWIARTSKTDALIRDFKAKRMQFIFSESKQQWWTRDTSPVVSKKVETTADPAIVKQNQQAFISWLKKQDYDMVELLSIYGAARKIHAMLISEGMASGLFGVQELSSVRSLADAAKRKEKFKKGAIAERRLWSQSLDCYLRFFAEIGTVKDEPQVESTPVTTSKDVTAEIPDSKTAVTEAGQDSRKTLTSEEGLRQWLKDNKPQVNADSAISAIRTAEKFAQRTHMRGNRLLMGIAPSAVKAYVNHLVISRAFANSDAQGYREFKSVAPLFIEYAGSLFTPEKNAPAASSPAEVPAPTATEVQAEDATGMEASLAKLLQGEQFADLRKALMDKGIRKLEDFKRLNLWVFMNQNGLYSIGQRQTVYSTMRRALASEGETKTAASWKLVTPEREYTASSPAGALVEYCRAIAAKYPLRFRGLVGQRMIGTNVAPLSRTRQHAGDLHFYNPDAYVDSEIDADTARIYAKWIGTMCRDNDLPQAVTSIAPARSGSPSTDEEDQTETREDKPGSGNGGQIASLTSSEDYSVTKPISVTYNGVTIPTDSWQNVYLEVCRRLYDTHMTQMLDLVNSDSASGIAWHYANSQTKRWMRSPKEFVPGCFFESNLPATYIMRRIRRLLRYFEATEQFVIRYQSLTDTTEKKPEPVLEKKPEPVPEKKPEPVPEKKPEPVPEKKPEPVPEKKPEPVPEKKSEPVPEKPPEKLVVSNKPPEPSPLQKKVEQLVLAADLEGMTLEQLYEQIPVATMVALKQIRDNSVKLVDIADRLIHVDAFVDWEDGANKLEEILEKLLAKNNGYVSSAQLYEYVRAEMQMFLNDNDMDDPHKVFDMAEHLFEKEGYHGKRFTFWMNAHISRSKETVTSNLDVFRKYARDHNGFFRYDDLVEYLERVGIKTGSLRGQMQLGYKPIFFYYSSEEIISAESMGIDNAWLDQAEKALQRLFADVGDHVVLRLINPIWYEQMPTLPGYLPWTPLLLQCILQFYGTKLGAKTIGSELNQKYDVLHAMLVTSGSEIQTFADAVVAYLVDSGIPERQFEAEELRGRLVDGGLIAGGELIGHMPKAIGSDPRFAWNASGGKVSIKV